MHVVHAADYGNPSAGSFIPSLIALARALRSRGDTMTVVAPEIAGATWHDDLRDAGADLVLVTSPAAAAAAVRSRRADIAHVHFFGYYVPVTSALSGTGTRIFWHMHSYVPNVGSFKERAKGFVRYRLFGRRVERFIAVSEAIAAELRTAGAPAHKIVVIPNGVDQARFRPPSGPERREARRSLDLAGDERVVLFFGRDRRIKGADTLWRAMERVPALTLLVVGASVETLEEFRRRARVVSIDFLADVRPLFWAADSIAVPSRGEGLPFALAEGLACGLPAVVTAIPALLDLTRGLNHVISVPIDDHVVLASALSQVTQIDAARSTGLSERYSLTHWLNQIQNLYRPSDSRAK